MVNKVFDSSFYFLDFDLLTSRWEGIIVTEWNHWHALWTWMPGTCMMISVNVPAHHCMEELIAHSVPGTHTRQAPVDSRVTYETFQLGNNSLSMSSLCSHPPGWVTGYRCGCATPGTVHWAHPQCPLCWSRRGNLHSKLTLHNSSTLTLHQPHSQSCLAVHLQPPCEIWRLI